MYIYIYIYIFISFRYTNIIYDFVCLFLELLNILYQSKGALKKGGISFQKELSMGGTFGGNF